MNLLLKTQNLHFLIKLLCFNGTNCTACPMLAAGLHWLTISGGMASLTSTAKFGSSKRRLPRICAITRRKLWMVLVEAVRGLGTCRFEFRGLGV